MKKYYPYKSFKEGKTFYIITNDDKRIHFGNKAHSHFTISPHYNGHLDWEKQQEYENIHRDNQDLNDANTHIYWEYWYLNKFPTHYEALDWIEKDLRKRGYLQ